MEKNKLLHKSLYERSFTNGSHSLLKQADARGSGDIIYVVLCDAYR